MSETRALTIAEFLLARIAEDEAVAESAANLTNGGRWWVDGPAEKSGKWWIYDVGEKFMDEPVAEHIARHGPDRVLAECEAKRQIAERCSAVSLGMPSKYLADGILSMLALPYSSHPHFREEWRVARG